LQRTPQDLIQQQLSSMCATNRSCKIQCLMVDDVRICFTRRAPVLGKPKTRVFNHHPQPVTRHLFVVTMSASPCFLS
jgi:hypothetical protein